MERVDEGKQAGGGDRDKGHSRGRFLLLSSRGFFLPFSPYLRDRGTTASRRCRFDDSGALCPAPTTAPGEGLSRAHASIRHATPFFFRLIELHGKRVSRQRLGSFFPHASFLLVISLHGIVAGGHGEIRWVLFLPALNSWRVSIKRRSIVHG